MNDPVITSHIGHIKAGLPVDGGERVECRVTFKEALSDPKVVSIQSSHGEVASFPNGPRVLIPAGETSAAFELETNPVSRNIRILISGHSTDGVFVAAHQDIRSTK